MPIRPVQTQKRRERPAPRPRFKIGASALVRKLAIHKAAGRRVVLKSILCESTQSRPRALTNLPWGPVYLAEWASPDGARDLTIIAEAHLEFEHAV